MQKRMKNSQSGRVWSVELQQFSRRQRLIHPVRELSSQSTGQIHTGVDAAKQNGRQLPAYD